MKTSSFSEDLTFSDKKVLIKVLLETTFSKEIRILFKKGQMMKEHKTPFPILVHVLEGEIDFGVQGVVHHLKKGDIVALEGDIPHDLAAKEDSIVRLTLSKSDRAERVVEVVENSSK